MSKQSWEHEVCGSCISLEKQLDKEQERSAALARELEEVRNVLRNLVRHDKAADWRAGFPNCRELEIAEEFLSRLTKEESPG
jgi:hypothetical protein